MTLEALVGTWDGTGRGKYPTIDSFDYREVLEVDEAPGALHYRQSTWRIDNHTEVPSHQETGFITLGDDGTVEVLNAQGTDRVEVLRGATRLVEAVLVIDVESVAFANDDRMLHSWRRLAVSGDVLRYRMGMATTAVPDGELHLTAALVRR